ncbi:MAG: hypothetical protein AB7I01_20630 [Gammaproteobacteria bacterium]
MQDTETQHAVARRLRLFSSFEGLGEDARRAVVAAGEVRDVESGESICVLGERDEHVHYLLEGMVRLEMADGSMRDLHAGDGPARQALDEPGYKLASIVATHPSRVFRIDPASLPGTPAPGSVTPAPAASFTETFSGQQLAALVGALRSEHQGLAGVASAPPAVSPDGGLGERTVSGVELDLPDLESTRGPQPVARDEPDSPPPATPGDPLASLTRAFEADLRRVVDTLRAEERTRAQFKLKAYADKLKLQAEEQLKAKARAMRARYEQANAAREADIRKRYEQLLDLANRLTRQKAEINQARQQIEDKLKRAESLHRELAELGGVVSGHLEQIDEMLPADDGELERDLGVRDMLRDVLPAGEAPASGRDDGSAPAAGF